MVAYTYSRVSALNFNTTPPTVAKSATGKVYAVADTTFTTALNVTMVVGGAVTTALSSDANGFFADFTVADRTSVVWKQDGSSFTTVLTTTDPVPGPAGVAGAAGAAGVKGDRGDLATWQASTFYPLSQVIANPSGDLVKVTTAHTSGASYDASKFGWVNNNAANLTGLLPTASLPSIPEANLPANLAAAALSATYAPINGGNTTNRRGLALDVPTFDDSFIFSKISANQDGWIAVKDLTVTGGFGGQVGQGGPISYFKAIGIAAHHSGQGNYDHFWGSLYHDGTREAGMFIADITGRRGGNAYGGHFRVTSQTTAPPFLVGLSLEVVPNIAKATQTTGTLATTIPASTPTTSVVLNAAVQLTDGTNLSFTAADASTVVAYVNGNMGSSSTTVPVTSFTTASPINSGGTVTIGVNSTYLGLLVEQNGSETASAAISITGPGSAATPYNFGLNFDSTAASSAATAIMVGGSWGAGINMNANSITSVGSITSTGSSPNRDVRLVDNLVLDNARHVKFKDAGGTSKKVLGVTSTDNFRLIAPGPSKQWEFYDSTEATMLARITGSGRADFATGGVTTKYTSGATQPSYLTNGQMEVWHDTGSGTSYLVVNVNGVSKKVALA